MKSPTTDEMVDEDDVVKALMKTLSHSKIRRYLNESVLSINGAHMLAYSQPVKRCAEALWE